MRKGHKQVEQKITFSAVAVGGEFNGFVYLSGVPFSISADAKAASIAEQGQPCAVMKTTVITTTETSTLRIFDKGKS